jgi:hypothetical protein
MQYEYVMPWQHIGPIRSSPKKSFCQYRWCTCSRCKVTLITVVSSNETTYAIMISVPTEKHNNVWRTSPLIPQVVPTSLTLRGQRCNCYENVFTSCGRDHKTTLGLHSLYAQSWSVPRQTRKPYCTIGTVHKQASSWGDRSEIHITRREENYHLTLAWCVIIE